MAWQADSVQGSIFTTNASGQLDAYQVWQLVTDGAPVGSFHNQTDMPNVYSTAEGAFEGLNLHVLSQFGRITLTLSPGAPPQSAPPSQPHRIADPLQASDIVRRALQKAWVKTGIVRAALVCDLSEIVDQPQDVTRKLIEYTGAWFPFPPLDALYQYNIRRQYEHSPFQMNRVSSWSAGFIQVIEQPLLFPAPITPRPRVHLQVPIVSWKLDINSATGSDVSAFAGSMLDEHHSEFEALIRLGPKRIRE